LHQQLEDKDMRKPRDYDAELKSLEDKAQELKARKVRELGELVIATGADALAPEELAGALIVLAETTDPTKRKAWAKRGAAMFRQRSRRSSKATDRNPPGAAAQPGRSLSSPGGNRPA
jgi:DNA-binding protein H-NS